MSGNFTLKSHQCPKCGASLEIFPNQEMVTCDYCNNNFSLAEKAPPPPVKQQETEVKPKTDYDYQYQKTYLETQKQLVNTGKGAAKIGGLISIVMILVIGGLVAYMTMSVQNRVKDSQNKVQRNIKIQAKIRKDTQKQKVLARWNKFVSDNSSKIAKKDLNSLTKLSKELKLPILGNVKAKTTMYLFAKFSSGHMYGLKKFRRGMKRYLAKYPDQLNFVMVPIPRENTKKFKGVEALFEVLFEKGDKVWWRFFKKLLHNSYSRYGTKSLAKIAKKVGCNPSEFTKALKRGTHKPVIKKLEKLSDTLDLPVNSVAFLIGENLYSTSAALSRLDEIIKKTFETTK
jgi:uncharacterized Zn finger protein (UPF0148 family)